MIAAIPCISHGKPGADDERLLEALALARKLDEDVASGLASLVDFDGRLLATWHSEAARSNHAAALTKAWSQITGSDGALHLVPTDEDYDYQEDCMNDPS